MVRLTEKEFESLNNKVKLSLSKPATPKKQGKISLGNNIKSDKAKPKNVNVKDIINENKKSKISTTVSKEHFSIVFEGAKLLSINQIFAILQYRKYEIFSYKKNWHELIKEALKCCYLEEKTKGKQLPFFDASVEITIFRQAPRLVDEDALTTMFKFIIDALKRTKENPYGILAEDNPKIVHKIECYSEKGEHCVGIRVKLIDNNKKETYSAQKILDNPIK